ncbi:MAG: 3-oxoacyl-[acyl-carrier-protein] synthase II, partial [Nonlabens sp.]
ADAYHLTGTHPEGEGAFLGMNEALREAEIKAADIDYINMHATSTPMGDASELKAIARVFGKNPDLNISATKSMTGHLLGAAGAIEAIASIMTTIHNVIPPTINTKDVDPDWAGKYDLTLGKSQEREVNYAMSNTFGFGGHIATAIFKKYKA